MTTDELVEFVSDKENCEICGKKITWYSGIKHLISSSPTLDRLNNESDIHINNIQLLCNECNRTKGTKTMKEFVNYCKIVSSKYEDLCESE
jgi:5-methylcytosine-specific restriction endonuclease McrA